MAKNAKKQIKKEEKLNPILEDNSNLPDIFNDLNTFKENEEDIEFQVDNRNNSDSFFKSIIKGLFSPKNIGMKTEYKSVEENFAGAKIDFLSKFANMPYMKDFLNSWEEKRVSLERKGRIEIIRALEKREQEIQQEKVNNLRNMFNVQ